MSIEDFHDQLTDELATIIDSDFGISITNTTTVPTPDDSAITFPNLDNKTLGCKLIESCVLHVDVRGSTALNNAHRKETMAKLYSAFVRGMVRCADCYGGKVRGIIGDRVMVVFDSDSCCTNAIETAVLMNSVSRVILNRLFKHNEISCGIGIDYGKMLVTKTGVVRHQAENSSYKSLVWLGPPANVASKLADIANKELSKEIIVINELHEKPPPLLSTGFLGLAAGLQAQPPGNEWRKRSLEHFLNDLQPQYINNSLVHRSSSFRSFSPRGETVTNKTNSILATHRVLQGYRKELKGITIIARHKWNPQPHAKVAGFSGSIYGCNDVDPVIRKKSMKRFYSGKRKP